MFFNQYFFPVKLEIYNTIGSSHMREVLLRDPHYDVYMTFSFNMRRVEACKLYSMTSYKMQAHVPVCKNEPKVYLLELNNGTCYKDSQTSGYTIIFMYNDPKTNHQVTMYTLVTKTSWELNLRRQSLLIKTALSTLCKSAFRSCILSLFGKSRVKKSVKYIKKIKIKRKHKKYRKSRKIKRKKRYKRCVVDRGEIKKKIFDKFISDTFIKKILEVIIRSSVCLKNETNPVKILDSITWWKMNSEEIEILSCIVVNYVRKSLRSALMSLADTTCIRQRVWGKLVYFFYEIKCLNFFMKLIKTKCEISFMYHINI